MRPNITPKWRDILFAALVAGMVSWLSSPGIAQAQATALEAAVAPQRVADVQAVEVTMGFAHHPMADRLTISPGLRARYQAELPLSVELDASRAHVLLGTETSKARVAGLAIAEVAYDTRFAAAGPGLAFFAATDRVPPDDRGEIVGATLLTAMARLGVRDGLWGWFRGGLSLDAGATDESDGGFAALFLLSGGASVPVVIASRRIALEYDISVTFIPFFANQRLGPRIWLVGEPDRPILSVFVKYQHLSAFRVAAPGHGVLVGVEYRLSVASPGET